MRQSYRDLRSILASRPDSARDGIHLAKLLSPMVVSMLRSLHVLPATRAGARAIRHWRWVALLALVLAPEAVTAAQLTLTWTDNAGNETGYRVERKTGSSGSYSEIGVLPVSTTTYTDTNVAGSTTYCYRVRAYNDAGNSGYSNEACRTTSISPFSIAVSKAGTGTGTVASTPAGIDCGTDCNESYAGGTVVTLSATPGSGSRFDGWSGGGCAGIGSCTLTGNSSLSVSATFTSTSSGATCPTGQYRAEYYNNTGLTGTPVLTRCESRIAYNWGTGGPGNGVPNDNFSVRWTGRFNFAAASHIFTAQASDGIRVWVDGASVIDAWKDQLTTTYRATVPLTAGTHEVKVEYYERGGGALARVYWVFWRATSGGAVSGESSSGGSIVAGGSLTARGASPAGTGGSPGVIHDGAKPPAESTDARRQYDSWDAANAATEDWVEYTYPRGWLTSLFVQVRQNGQRVNVSNLSTTLAYAGNNGVSFEPYTLTFNAIQGDGIRPYVAPGGSAAFISIGELPALALVDPQGRRPFSRATRRAIRRSTPG
jgi:hypothetical protein